MEPISSIAPIIAPVAGQTGTASAVNGRDFSASLSNALTSVSNAEKNADALALEFASGGPVEPHQVTLAATQASLATELLTAVRDRALDAYQQIMSLQL